MKKHIMVFLIVLTMLLGISLTASARDIEYFTGEDGIEYCWVRGGSNEKPTRTYRGKIWVAVYVDGARETRLGECEDAWDEDHVCDIFCNFERLEYKWRLDIKEVLTIESINPDGYSMIGTEFILLKQEIKTDDDGSYLLDADGKLQYESSTTIGKGTVEKDGYARIKLDESRMETRPDFLQLMLGQILPEDKLDTYCALQKRWYVNLVLNSDDEYEVYSVTEAPPVNLTDPDELANSNFGVLGETSVPEFNKRDQILKTQNEYRVGDIIVDVVITGFEQEIPTDVKTYITVTGPNDYNKRLRKSETLKSVRMGEYLVEYSAPVPIENYAVDEPIVDVQYLAEEDEQESVAMIGDAYSVLLNREHANAIVTITYNYTALHVHEYETVVIEPSCMDTGYTVYNCIDPECDYSYQVPFGEAFGHDYLKKEYDVTCTTDGYIEYICRECDDMYREVTEIAPGHDYNIYEKKPTCVEEGYNEYKCKKCGLEFQDDFVEAKGHGDYKYKSTVDRSCTQKAYEVYVCVDCKDEYHREFGEEPEGHKYDEGVITDPTCTSNGYTTFTCGTCGYSYPADEVEAFGHDYDKQVVKPTTKREGYTVYTCKVCKDTYTDDIKDKLSSSNKNNSNDDTKVEENVSASAPAAPQTPGFNAPLLADTLIVKTYDDVDNPLDGTVVALFKGKTQVTKWNCTYDNTFVIDNLYQYVKDGETTTFSLKQIKAPNGYEVSQDSFDVVISRQNDIVQVKVGKTKNSLDGSSSAIGEDGKAIISFRSPRMKTQIAVACQVDVEFDENCWIDENYETECLEKEHEFVLEWENTNGQLYKESIVVANGESKVLKTEIPYGAKYNVSLVDPEGTVTTLLSENANGSVTDKMVEDVISVNADLKYKVESAEPLALEMMVTDPVTDTPLQNAAFYLKDQDGETVGVYTSDNDGKLTIADTFVEPGDYLLTQSRVSDGYEPLKGGAPIHVTASYAIEEEEEGANRVAQTMVAEIAHQAVSLDEDGVYRIENPSEYVPEQAKEKKGKLGLILGIIGCVIAAACAVLRFVLSGRRPEMETEEFDEMEETENLEEYEEIDGSDEFFGDED